nr:unnamed protein product [Callosobruchus analis]
MKLPSTMCDYQFISSDHSAAYGKFYSPRYPSTYPKNIRCSYRFRASCLNRADIIRVYDGRSTSAPSIRLLCNEGTEYEVLSTGSELLIEFVANSDRPGRGFRAKYQFQPAVDDASVDTLKYSRLGGSSFPTEVEPNVSETSK